MYSLWWPNNIVPVHVSKVVKNLRVMCENITSVLKSLILWWYEIWDMRKSNTLTHNHNCLMETITFELHPITPISPRNTLATIFKSILILLAFVFLCIFSFWTYHALAYIEREEIPNYVSQKHHNFAIPKHTNVIHDWQDLVVRWLFMLFSLDFLVIPIKKSNMSVKYKRLLNHVSHKTHLLNCALKCSSKLQEIQSLEKF